MNPPGRHPYRWAMLAGVWAVYFCFGMTTASLAPLVAPIKADLGIGNAAMGGVLGAWPLVYIFAALPCGMLVDRIGVRWSLTLGAAVIAASGGLRGLAGDATGLFLAVAVFGLGGPLVSVGAPKAIAQWFAGPERGFALGACLTGPYLGAALAFSLTHSVAMPLAGGDWRSVAAGYAGLTLAACLIWLAITAHPASRSAEREASASADTRVSAFIDLLALPPVRLILAMAVLAFFFGHGLHNWMPEILRAGGMSPIAAGYWAAAPTLVAIAAALAVPRLAAPARRMAIIAALLVCGALAALLIQAGSGAVLTAGLVLQGVVRGALGAVVILLLMETDSVGAERMGAAGGLYFTAGEVGGVLGPLSVGVLAEATGGFAVPLYLLSAVCAVELALLARLRAHQRRRQRQHQRR